MHPVRHPGTNIRNRHAMPRKEGIRKLFDNIAPDYDRLNHILSLDIDRIWRKKAIQETLKDLPADSARILDVACGTGDFAIGLAKNLKNGSTVTGSDISEGMLRIGREKAEKAGMSAMLSLELGDCENLPYRDGLYDRVTAAFGVRNFEHLETGLKEMLRVLKPGGKLVILELSVPGNRLLFALYRLYFLHVLPAIGGAVSGNRGAYEYLPASVLRFPKPEEFKKMLSSCGFSEVFHRSFTFGICRMYVGTKGQNR